MSSQSGKSGNTQQTDKGVTEFLAVIGPGGISISAPACFHIGPCIASVSVDAGASPEAIEVFK